MIDTFTSGSACVAVWSGEPTLSDCQHALEAVTKHHNQLGRRVVLVSVLAPDARMPGPGVAHTMKAAWPALLAMASTTQYVVLPRGFVAARLLNLLAVGFGLAFRGHDVVVSQDLKSVLETAKGDPEFRGSDVISGIERVLRK